MEIRDRLNKADTSEKPKIQKELGLAEAKNAKQMAEKNAEKIYDDAVQRIESGGAAISSTNVNNNTNRDINGRFQSPASNANGAGAGYGAGSMLGGRRKSRRYRRR